MQQRLSVRKSLFWILLLVTGFVTLQSGIALTQDESDTSQLEFVTTDEVLAFTEVLSRQKVTPDKEAEKDLALSEKIESAFDTAVKKIAGVLFYELMATERQFVQFDHREYYIRPVTAAPDTPTGGLATLIGLIGGVIVYFSVIILDTKLKIDDPVGAISAHGTVGIWGIMATPLSGAGAFGTQFLGALIIFAWVFITSFIVLKVLDSLVGIRASEEDEELGLDKAEIGVEAYPDFK